MTRTHIVACIGLVVAIATAPREAIAKPSVAVLGLALEDGTGIDERAAEIARQLTEAMRKRARSPRGPYALSAAGEKELVDALMFAGCETSSTACLVKIGSSKDMNVDFLIYGKVGKQGKNVRVSLTLLDVREKQVRNMINESTTDISSGALEKWGEQLYKQLVGEPDTGEVLISANVDEGNVFVDGKARGRLVDGKARISGLSKGDHDVRVVSGGVAGEGTVTIEVGETAELSITLTPGVVPPETPKGRPGGIWRGVFIGSAALTVIAGGFWTYQWYSYAFGNGERNYGSEFCGDAMPPPAGPDGMTGTPDDGEEFNAAFNARCKALDRAFIAGGVTIGALVLSGVSFYMGYIRPPKPGEAQVTPMVTPDGNGAGASLRIVW